MVCQDFDVVVEVDEVQGLEGISIRIHSNTRSDADVAFLSLLHVFLVEGAGEVVFEGALLQIVGVVVGAVENLLVGGEVDEDFWEVAGERFSLGKML